MSEFQKGFIRWMSGTHVGLYRFLGGGTAANKNTLILTTRGRKTGREIPKPLLYVEDGGRLYIVASYGGNDSPPAWYLNLTQNPDVRVECGSSRGEYRARTISIDEKKAIWPKLTEIWPGYDGYQLKTSREIPVVELTPK
ncbi:MAG TPA: nitroreductase/quinone reductase family protein [Candidatus Binataceae bacterium]|nr:nitroreductase/quinone reductase family protein [Candidatus Binataceae bacterium]